jgi:hypothetical protein
VSQLYEKRGRRYVPVHDTTAMDGLSNGAWLVVVQNGLVSVRRAVDDGPVIARVAATIRLREIIARRLQERTASIFGRGLSSTLTPRERRAAKAYRVAMGDPDCMIWMTRPDAMSAAEAVAADLVAITEHIEDKSP